MIPSLLAREITRGLRDFVITGYETTTPYFAGLFGRFVDAPGNLYKGPYVSVALPFEPGGAGRDYFARFASAFSPHAHQQAAWERLRAGGNPRSTVVATGTGSGKTECFLYPLLDDCVRRSRPGIKAIVIYPMNALANDQAKRFAAAIHGCQALRDQVRVGLFVGEGEHTPQKAMGPEQVITDKDTQRAAPPDILLTNYKMLDYLLMRPKDRPLWRHNGPETLRYLVVDELHTFDGAQGTDLACLIRRLKARLDAPPGQMVCVGTSATLGSSEERDDLLRYASRIFQEPFDEDAVVGEQRQGRGAFLGDALIEHQLLPQPGLAGVLDPERYDGVEDYIAGQYRLFFQREADGDVLEPTWRQALGEGLKRHLVFHNLLRLLEIQPRGLDELIAELGKTLPAGEARDAAAAVLDALCALIAWARAAEPARDGCYGCLYAYRNAYGMETTSRDTAVELLSDILAREDRLETTTTVGDVWVNPVLGSELEAQFIAAIHRLQLQGQEVRVHQHVVNGKPGYLLQVGDHLYTVEPQVPLGPTSGVAIASCPDFLIREARSGEDFTPIAVFLDGFHYHKDKVTDDTLKRLAIVQSGKYRQWTLTWQDVNPQFASGEIRNPFTEGLNPEMQPLQERLGGALGVAEVVHLAVQAPLEQLLRYLEKPSAERWRAVAMIRALGWFDQARMRSEALADDFRQHLQSECSTPFRELLEAQPNDRAHGGLAQVGTGQICFTDV